MLRHPSYKGLRDDKRPLDVVLEKSEEPTASAAATTSAESAPLLRTLIGGEPRGSAEVTLDGQALELTNLDEVVYPATGFTKADVIDYYMRVGPVLLPHVRDRHDAPADLASLVRLANAEMFELRTSLARRDATERPTALVFGLDPGEGADLDDCRELALLLRGMFDQLGLATFPKTTGSAGMQVYVPLNDDVTYDDAEPFAKAVAETLTRGFPGQKVGADCSPNAAGGSAIAPYSLRAEERPTVSMPLTWEEVQSAPAAELVFEPGAALRRVDERGDLFAPVLTLRQELPSFD
jgi:bifunctional non-homologous end joining protein LigD